MNGLGDFVERLKNELNEITRVYVEMQSDEMTHVMVQLEAMKDEINRLDAYVIRQRDERCIAVVRKKFTQYFNESETKTLILDMGISEFEYTGQTMTGMHTEFIGFCERREMLPLLMSALHEHRPRVKWPEC